MSRADGQAQVVRNADRRHRGDLGGRTLCIAQMRLANLLADRHHDSLPANHGAEPECHGHGHLHPGRNEPRGPVDVLTVVAKDAHFRLAQSGVPLFSRRRSASLTRYLSLRRFGINRSGTFARWPNWATSLAMPVTSWRRASMVSSVNRRVATYLAASSQGSPMSAIADVP